MRWHDGREKALLALGLLAFFGGGYFGIGFLTDLERAHSLATPIDTALPFIAGFIRIYIWVIPAAAAPLFLVRSQPLYRRAILAYALTIAIAYIVFLLYPVSPAGLRATATLDVTRLSELLPGSRLLSASACRSSAPIARHQTRWPAIPGGAGAVLGIHGIFLCRYHHGRDVVSALGYVRHCLTYVSFHLTNRR